MILKNLGLNWWPLFIYTYRERVRPWNHSLVRNVAKSASNLKKLMANFGIIIYLIYTQEDGHIKRQTCWWAFSPNWSSLSENKSAKEVYLTPQHLPMTRALRASLVFCRNFRCIQQSNCDKRSKPIGTFSVWSVFSAILTIRSAVKKEKRKKNFTFILLLYQEKNLRELWSHTLVCEELRRSSSREIKELLVLVGIECNLWIRCQILPKKDPLRSKKW